MTELVEVYASLFVQCWSQYAVQQRDGSYWRVREPLTLPLLTAHLLGQCTLGTYLLDEHNRLGLNSIRNRILWGRMERVRSSGCPWVSTGKHEGGFLLCISMKMGTWCRWVKRCGNVVPGSVRTCNGWPCLRWYVRRVRLMS